MKRKSPKKSKTIAHQLMENREIRRYRAIEKASEAIESAVEALKEMHR